MILHYHDLSGFTKTKKTGRYRTEKRNQMHVALNLILNEFAEMRANNGVKYAELPALRAWPFVICVVTDEPEAQLLALLNAYRFCMIDKSQRGCLDGALRVDRCYVATGTCYLAGRINNVLVFLLLLTHAPNHRTQTKKVHWQHCKQD